MRYQKPSLVDLNSITASGYVPACLPGTTVATMDCSVGGTDTACYSGSGGIAYEGDCIAGAAPNTPGTGSCLSGGTTGYECASGSVPLHAGTCTVGPSIAI